MVNRADHQMPVPSSMVRDNSTIRQKISSHEEKVRVVNFDEVQLLGSVEAFAKVHGMSHVQAREMIIRHFNDTWAERRILEVPARLTPAELNSLFGRSVRRTSPCQQSAVTLKRNPATYPSLRRTQYKVVARLVVNFIASRFYVPFCERRGRQCRRRVAPLPRVEPPST